MATDKDDYSKHYSEDSFWKKLLKYGKKAGVSVVYATLILYYTLQKPDLPMKTKSIILGALGYFIFPIDLIPDITPVVGYGDDVSVIIGALMVVAMHIDDETKDKARNKVKDLFGEEAISEVHDIDEKLNKQQQNPEE